MTRTRKLLTALTAATLLTLAAPLADAGATLAPCNPCKTQISITPTSSGRQGIGAGLHLSWPW